MTRVVTDATWMTGRPENSDRVGRLYTVIFTTKAEYGVRLLIQLGRRQGQPPVSLKVIAEEESLPLAYLERIAALLKKAQLITATRGAHGGYLLTRPAAEITMDSVVLALEGAIAPIECISADADGGLVCTREGQPGHDPCPTKLLWTRVQGSIVRTLGDMTLADLVRPTKKEKLTA